MIDRQALRAVRSIVVHDDCSDGLASAILLHDALPQAELHFLDYGTEAHENFAARPGLLFCDFSPPRLRANEFVAEQTIVLDHHRTARDVVGLFGTHGIFADEALEPGVSGAVLAYRHVWRTLRHDAPGQHFAEWFARIAGVRDTWQKASTHWHDGCVQDILLMAFPRELWLQKPLEEIGKTWDSHLSWVGEALLAKERARVEKALASAYRFVTRAGLRIVVFQGLGVASDAADLVDEGADAIVAFGLEYERSKPLLRVSLRSQTTFDCGAFASRYGGGGHTRAAGFSVALAPEALQPYAFVEQLFASSD